MKYKELERSVKSVKVVESSLPLESPPIRPGEGKLSVTNTMEVMEVAESCNGSALTY